MTITINFLIAGQLIFMITQVILATIGSFIIYSTIEDLIKGSQTYLSLFLVGVLALLGSTVSLATLVYMAPSHI